MIKVPRYMFFTKGVGVHKYKLGSFELALRNAGIGRFNIVNVSSIFPPNCSVISRKRGLSMLKTGQIIYCVMARIETNEPNRLISAAIGLAIPTEGDGYGYISEYHAYGVNRERAKKYAEDLAVTMLATTLGIESDTEKARDERIKTMHICQSARGNKDGLWTTCIAAAIFVE